MNYYEELGVSETATVEEIRHAYKAMARLLHPDNQSDLTLRAAAERQMARLNGIVSVLVDTEQRRHYDEHLHASPAANSLAPNGISVKPHRVWTPAPEPPYIPPRRFQLLRFAAQNWSWILTGLVIAGASITFALTGNRPTVVREWNTAIENSLSPRALDRDHPLTKGRGAKPESDHRRLSEDASLTASRPQPVTVQPALPAPMDVAPEPLRTSSANPPASNATERSTLSTTPPTPPSPVPVPVPAPPSAPASPAPSTSSPMPAGSSSSVAAIPSANGTRPLGTDDPFSGRWFFTAANNTPAGPFPTDSIELHLRNENGSLRGEYRAVYRVPDRSVAPEVAFDLEGRVPAGRMARLDWISSDSGRGLMDIVMRVSGELDVTWWTTQFGKRATLRSGKAILTKEHSR